MAQSSIPTHLNVYAAFKNCSSRYVFAGSYKDYWQDAIESGESTKG